MWSVSHTKWILRRFDHSAIYWLIAGTYTPFIAQMENSFASGGLLTGVWLSADFGVVLKLVLPGRYLHIDLGTATFMGAASGTSFMSPLRTKTFPDWTYRAPANGTRESLRQKPHVGGDSCTSLSRVFLTGPRRLLTGRHARNATGQCGLSASGLPTSRIITNAPLNARTASIKRLSWSNTTRQSQLAASFISDRISQDWICRQLSMADFKARWNGVVS